MTADPHHERRWLILAALGLAQLMVILDVTVVNIALPSAQRAPGFSDADRQWVVTAYTLSFGGLLLLAGRLADLAGRKRTLLPGLVGFVLASALGGTVLRHARRRRQRPRLRHRVLVVSRAAGHRRAPVLGADRKPPRPARDCPRRPDRPAGRGPLTDEPKEPR